MARTKIASPVNATTFAERQQQARTARKDGGALTGIWRAGGWTGFGGALECIAVINRGDMSPYAWDNVTENPSAAAACQAETGEAPDWVALGRKSAAGYIVPMVWDTAHARSK